jgi:hypothetical protein
VSAPRAPLPAPDRLVAMAAWVPRVLAFAWSVEPRFRREALPDYLRSITPARASGGPPLRPDEMTRVIANVLRWKRGRLNHGCFVRSLTRYHFLRRLGLPVTFHLGVEPGPGDEAARSHAWLCLDGRPYLETEAARIAGYRPLFAWPPA